MRQIILDTETTGLDPSKGHRIIEIGCVELINRQLTNNHFHTYINPERDIDAGAQQVHGITLAFLKDKPVFKTILKDFIHFIDDAELIIHNAPFDVGFIDHEFHLANYKEKKIADHCRITDTLVLAKQRHPGQRNNLDALCKRYYVNNAHREQHGALLDATLLAHVYLAMTGGQVSLFEEEAALNQEQTKKTKQTISSITNKIDLPIIQANDEEQQLHAEQLDVIQKQSKVCLWTDLEIE